MGYFTALQESFYPNARRPALSTGADFDLGDAKTLGWAAQLAYEIDDQPKFNRILSAWGWTLKTSLSATLPGLTRIRTISGYVAQAGAQTIVAFAGTEPEHLQDWIRDFAFVPNADGVHGGFADRVSSIEDVLQDVAAAAPGAIWFTGHSLGAAIAALSAYRLCTRGSPNAAQIEAVSGCGMPRLGIARFTADYVTRPIAGARSLGEKTFRLIYGDDIVPTLPPSQFPFRFCHVGQALKAPHAGLFAPASIEPGPIEPEDATAVSFLKAMISSLTLGSEANLPRYPAERADVAVFVEALPRAFRDHLMDRYMGAMG